LNLLLLLLRIPRICMGNYLPGKSCSDLGRLLVLNDPLEWRNSRRRKPPLKQQWLPR